MVRRMRTLSRVALLAGSLAVIGFGAAGYGAFGPVSTTNAILETTAQSPLDVLPRPSPVVDPDGAVAAVAQPSVERSWIRLVLVAGLLAAIVIAIALTRRRSAPG